MTICPYCNHENIDGADECEKCNQSLSSLSKPRPGSETERRITKDRIRQLVPREPIIVRPDTPTGEVLRQLAGRSVGCAVVVRDHEVVGIFTERDALTKLSVDAGQLADRPISEFMTAPVETLELEDPVAFALHKMDFGGYRHVPILNEGRITGVISVRDILNHITAAL